MSGGEGGAADPARRYKEVMLGLTAAADALRVQDEERVAALRERLQALEEELAAAEDRARRSQTEALSRWAKALDALWSESWLKMRPLPRPDTWADPAELDELDARVVRCSEALHQVLRQRWLGGHRPG